MIPYLAQNDLKLFYKYMDQATNYFEYGSGGSTFQACKRNNIKSIYSVESDLTWVNEIKILTKDNDKIKFMYNEMDTQPKTWGRPGKNSTDKQMKSYSDQLLTFTHDEQQSIDLVFIDGRFRVACCLKSFNVTSKDCLFIFDDFLNRPYYHVILDYFEIIDKTIDDRMVVLRKKKNVIIPEDLIRKYELIYE